MSVFLSQGKWNESYNNLYIVALKKKNYHTSYVEEVRGYKRPVTSVEEKIEKVFLINDSTMRNSKD
jgi:hypothetical protein